MYGVIRTCRIYSFISKHAARQRHNSVWKLDGNNNNNNNTTNNLNNNQSLKMKLLCPTNDSHIVSGCGFFVTYRKNNNFLSLHSFDSVIGYHEEIEENEIKTKELSLTPGKGLKTVSCGRNHIIALTNDNTAFSYGLTSLGQCGVVPAPHSDYPYVIGDAAMEIIGDKFKAFQVSCGLDHTLFLGRNGKVFACGWAADGQTGTGSSSFNAVPTPVVGDINEHVVTRIYTGANTSFAITESRLLYAWGNNEYGQLAIESNEPQVVKPQVVDDSSLKGGVRHVAAGDTFTTFMTESGQLFTCGYDPGHTDPSPKLRQYNNNDCYTDVRTGLHYCITKTASARSEDYLISIIPGLQLKLCLPPDTLSITAGPDTVFAISSK